MMTKKPYNLMNGATSDASPQVQIPVNQLPPVNPQNQLNNQFSNMVVTNPLEPPQTQVPVDTNPNKKDLIAYTNQNGQLSGFGVNGHTYIGGLKPSEVQNALNAQAGMRQIPQGVITGDQIQQEQQQMAQQQMASQQAQQLMNSTQLPQAQQYAEANQNELALKAGLGAIPEIAGGVIGGVIGSAVGGPVGTIGGALIGQQAVKAFMGAVTGKIKEEENAKIAVEYKNLQTSTKSMNQLIAYVNRGGPDREGAWRSFYNQLGSIDTAQSNLKQISDKELNKFLAVDTTKEMGYIDLFNQNLRDIYISKMQMAMLKPNPNDPLDEITINSFE